MATDLHYYRLSALTEGYMKGQADNGPIRVFFGMYEDDYGHVKGTLFLQDEQGDITEAISIGQAELTELLDKNPTFNTVKANTVRSAKVIAAVVNADYAGIDYAEIDELFSNHIVAEDIKAKYIEAGEGKIGSTSITSEGVDIKGYLRATTIEAAQGHIERLTSDDAEILKLRVQTGIFENLDVQGEFTADKVKATEGFFNTLLVNTFKADELAAERAYINQVSAETVLADRISALYADVNTIRSLFLQSEIGEFDVIHAGRASFDFMESAMSTQQFSKVGALITDSGLLTSAYIENLEVKNLSIVGEDGVTYQINIGVEWETYPEDVYGVIYYDRSTSPATEHVVGPGETPLPDWEPSRYTDLQGKLAWKRASDGDIIFLPKGSTPTDPAYQPYYNEKKIHTKGENVLNADGQKEKKWERYPETSEYAGQPIYLDPEGNETPDAYHEEQDDDGQTIQVPNEHVYAPQSKSADQIVAEELKYGDSYQKLLAGDRIIAKSILADQLSVNEILAMSGSFGKLTVAGTTLEWMVGKESLSQYLVYEEDLFKDGWPVFIKGQTVLWDVMRDENGVALYYFYRDPKDPGNEELFHKWEGAEEDAPAVGTPVENPKWEQSKLDTGQMLGTLHTTDKTSVVDIDRGFYLDHKGQFAIGSGSEYVRFRDRNAFSDKDGKEDWVLEIRAKSLTLQADDGSWVDPLNEINELSSDTIVQYALGLNQRYYYDNEKGWTGEHFEDGEWADGITPPTTGWNRRLNKLTEGDDFILPENSVVWIRARFITEQGSYNYSTPIPIYYPHAPQSESAEWDYQLAEAKPLYYMAYEGDQFYPEIRWKGDKGSSDKMRPYLISNLQVYDLEEVPSAETGERTNLITNSNDYDGNDSSANWVYFEDDSEVYTYEQAPTQVYRYEDRRGAQYFDTDNYNATQDIAISVEPYRADDSTQDKEYSLVADIQWADTPKSDEGGQVSLDVLDPRTVTNSRFPDESATLQGATIDVDEYSPTVFDRKTPSTHATATLKVSDKSFTSPVLWAGEAGYDAKQGIEARGVNLPETTPAADDNTSWSKELWQELEPPTYTSLVEEEEEEEEEELIRERSLHFPWVRFGDSHKATVSNIYGYKASYEGADKKEVSNYYPFNELTLSATMDGSIIDESFILPSSDYEITPDSSIGRNGTPKTTTYQYRNYIGIDDIEMNLTVGDTVSNFDLDMTALFEGEMRALSDEHQFIFRAYDEDIKDTLTITPPPVPTDGSSEDFIPELAVVQVEKHVASGKISEFETIIQKDKKQNELYGRFNAWLPIPAGASGPPLQKFDLSDVEGVNTAPGSTVLFEFHYFGLSEYQPNLDEINLYQSDGDQTKVAADRKNYTTEELAPESEGLVNIYYQFWYSLAEDISAYPYIEMSTEVSDKLTPPGFANHTGGVYWFSGEWSEDAPSYINSEELTPITYPNLYVSKADGLTDDVKFGLLHADTTQPIVYGENKAPFFSKDIKSDYWLTLGIIDGGANDDIAMNGSVVYNLDDGWIHMELGANQNPNWDFTEYFFVPKRSDALEGGKNYQILVEMRNISWDANATFTLNKEEKATEEGTEIIYTQVNEFLNPFFPPQDIEANIHAASFETTIDVKTVDDIDKPEYLTVPYVHHSGTEPLTFDLRLSIYEAETVQQDYLPYEESATFVEYAKADVAATELINGQYNIIGGKLVINDEYYGSVDTLNAFLSSISSESIIINEDGIAVRSEVPGIDYIQPLPQSDPDMPIILSLSSEQMTFTLLNETDDVSDMTLELQPSPLAALDSVDMAYAVRYRRSRVSRHSFWAWIRPYATFYKRHEDGSFELDDDGDIKKYNFYGEKRIADIENKYDVHQTQSDTTDLEHLGELVDLSRNDIKRILDVLNNQEQEIKGINSTIVQVQETSAGVTTDFLNQVQNVNQLNETLRAELIASGAIDADDETPGVLNAFIAQRQDENANPYLELGKRWLQTDEDGRDGMTPLPFSARLSNTELGFYENGERISYFSGEKMMIENAEILQDLAFGQFVWRPRKVNLLNAKKQIDSNMTMQWLGSPNPLPPTSGQPNLIYGFYAPFSSTENDAWKWQTFYTGAYSFATINSENTAKVEASMDRINTWISQFGYSIATQPLFIDSALKAEDGSQLYTSVAFERLQDGWVNVQVKNNVDRYLQYTSYITGEEVIISLTGDRLFVSTPKMIPYYTRNNFANNEVATLEVANIQVAENYTVEDYDHLMSIIIAQGYLGMPDLSKAFSIGRSGLSVNASSNLILSEDKMTVFIPLSDTSTPAWSILPNYFALGADISFDMRMSIYPGTLDTTNLPAHKKPWGY